MTSFPENVILGIRFWIRLSTKKHYGILHNLNLEKIETLLKLPLR